MFNHKTKFTNRIASSSQKRNTVESVHNPTLGTFQNGLNRQMVVLFRLGLDQSFTYAFTHLDKYYIITINIAEFQ